MLFAWSVFCLRSRGDRIIVARGMRACDGRLQDHATGVCQLSDCRWPPWRIKAKYSTRKFYACNSHTSSIDFLIFSCFCLLQFFRRVQNNHLFRLSHMMQCTRIFVLFRRFRKIAKRDRFVVCVRLSAWNNSARTPQIFVKFYIRVFFENLPRKFKFD
jgi:hypothetical protein